VPDYTEDPNSPFEVTQQTSLNAQLANPRRRVLILADPSGDGFNAMRVNGDAGANYDILRLSDSTTQGRTEWKLKTGLVRDKIQLVGNSFQIGMSTLPTNTGTEPAVAGRNNSVSGAITQFTLFDRGDFKRNARVRAYALDV